MLLKSLYDFAVSEKLLDVDKLAFKPKTVRWNITLNDAGELVGQGPMETEKEFNCPKTTRQKTVGGMAEFMADDIRAVFGLAPNQKKPVLKKIRRKYDDFWAQIKQAHEETHAPPLKALLVFKPNPGQVPSFFRWGISSDPKPKEKPAWWITKATGEEVELKASDNFSFRVGEQLLLEDECHIRPFWRKQFQKENEALEAKSPRGLCLVTGKHDQPLAETHSLKVEGVSNTQSSRAPIVSFDKDAFRSYGFVKSLNASTSLRVATAYCTALNYMLNSETHSIRLGQASCCFWTCNKTEATDNFGDLLNNATPDTVAKFLKSPWSGQERELLDQEQFYAVILVGNIGRIAVRHSMQIPLEMAVENLQRWFLDLTMESLLPPGEEKTAPLALFELASTTVRDDAKERFELASTTVRDDAKERDERKLQTKVVTQLLRVAWEGIAPSLTLLHPMLNRLRVDVARDGNKALLNHSRFALAKLILNRNRRDSIMEIAEKQTVDVGDVAYQCGQLLAVLAEAQAKAHGYRLKGPGVVERYFGAAMDSPASAFPTLLKLNRHHLSKIGKSDNKGHERFLEEAIQDVLKHVNEFPRMLDLHAQGRFAIGFYQQKAQTRAAIEATKQRRLNDEENQ